MKRHTVDTVIREAPFSHITECDGTIYLSGIIAADDPEHNGDPLNDITRETELCLSLVGKLLQHVDLDYGNVASVLVHLVDLSDFDSMNRAYGKFFTPGSQPVRTCVGVSELLAGARIEVTCIAHRN